MSDDPRRYPERPIIGVGAVVFDEDRVLLVKRGREPLKGEWSLPGGAVEVGESLETAVAREVFEETELHIEVGPVIEVLDRIQRTLDGRVEYHFVIVDYLCRPRDGLVKSGSDAADARWVPLADLPSYRLTTKAQAVIGQGLALARRER
jgi:ADP-ribose pyrophosphatase YjhB (NUDIX family)